MSHTGLELRSTIDASGVLTLSLEEVAAGDPGPGEVVVRVEAAPLNPSDLGLLIGPADPATLEAGGSGDRPVLRMTVPQNRLASVEARVGRSMAVGNEGAGTVVAAGPGAETLLGARVAALGGGMYAQFRRIDAASCVRLPEGTRAADGAAIFVNPLTALGFVETMRAEGHRAIVHTAAASSLGQILNRICLADGIGLVNVVRSAEQVALLEGQGATHVLDSTAPGFGGRLAGAIAETGATIAFDAIGGGELAGRILDAMEKAASAGRAYDRYGSDVFKQVYVYGMLDVGPTTLRRSFGFAWSVGGWLLTPFLRKAGPEVRARLTGRVLSGLTTMFASHYGETVGLAQLLRPATIATAERKGTGAKLLIDPWMG